MLGLFVLEYTTPVARDYPALYSWDLVKITSTEQVSITPIIAYIVKKEKPN